MRTLETRKYTLRDTPIISCVKKGLKECLEDLGQGLSKERPVDEEVHRGQRYPQSRELPEG